MSKKDLTFADFSSLKILETSTQMDGELQVLFQNVMILTGLASLLEYLLVYFLHHNNQVIFKKIGKRDDSTRLKAVLELVDFVSKATESQFDQVVPSWVSKKVNKISAMFAHIFLMIRSFLFWQLPI